MTVNNQKINTSHKADGQSDAIIEKENRLVWSKPELKYLSITHDTLNAPNVNTDGIAGS